MSAQTEVRVTVDEELRQEASAIWRDHRDCHIRPDLMLMYQ